MRRREVLSSVGLGLAAFAGCAGVDSWRERPANDEFGSDIESRYSRGGAPPETIAFEPHEPTDDLTPEDHEYDTGDRVVSIEYRNTTEEMDFEEFGRTRSRRAVVQDIYRRLEAVGTDLSTISVQPLRGQQSEQLRHSDFTIDFDDYEVIIQVSSLTIFDNEGNVYAEPDTDFDRIIELTPTNYTAMTEFADYEYSATVGVVCHSGAKQLDEPDAASSR